MHADCDRGFRRKDGQKMKRGICVILTAVMLLACAWAAAEDTREPGKEYFIQAAQTAYPGWTVWKTETFATGSGNGGYDHCMMIRLYRVFEHRMELKELFAVTNALREGDPIPWEETAYVPVEIAQGMEENLMTLKPEQIFDYGNGACFSDLAMEMLAPGLTGEGESIFQLMACSEYLMATVENKAGESFLRIAQWDGQAYHIVSTPAQESLCFNRIHSWNDFIEVYFGELEGVITRDADGSWRLGTINNGQEIICIGRDDITDITYGGFEQYNDYTHYGRPTFETDISKIQLTSIPSDLQSMLENLDRSLTVCTAHDGTPLYTKPDGEVMALCYTRVPGVIVSQTDEWIELQIGHEAWGLRAWARAEDLAFGGQTETVRCTFPSYDEFYEDEDEPVEGMALDGSVIQLDCSEHNPWLIGKTPDGSWLVLLNGEGNEKGMVCTVSEQAFANVRPTQREEWDEEEDEAADEDGMSVMVWS